LEVRWRTRALGLSIAAMVQMSEPRRSNATYAAL
jgi:hypothetical protein